MGLSLITGMYDPSEIALLVPVLLATLAGSLIGIERELRNKSAGIGTNILICAAAAMFTIMSARVDPLSKSRIAANILTGVGFIGAGLIMRNDKDDNVHGLTTAAGIWMAAAIGMAFGYGYYVSDALGTLIAIWSPRIPHWAYHKRAAAMVESIVPKVEPAPKAAENPKNEQKLVEKKP